MACETPGAGAPPNRRLITGPYPWSRCAQARVRSTSARLANVWGQKNYSKLATRNSRSGEKAQGQRGKFDRCKMQVCRCVLYQQPSPLLVDHSESSNDNRSVSAQPNVRGNSQPNTSTQPACIVFVCVVGSLVLLCFVLLDLANHTTSAHTHTTPKGPERAQQTQANASNRAHHIRSVDATVKERWNE